VRRTASRKIADHPSNFVLILLTNIFKNNHKKRAVPRATPNLSTVSGK
jgi:hypothetical protein